MTQASGQFMDKRTWRTGLPDRPGLVRDGFGKPSDHLPVCVWRNIVVTMTGERGACPARSARETDKTGAGTATHGGCR
jgi:hypothetical protein